MAVKKKPTIKPTPKKVKTSGKSSPVKKSAPLKKSLPKKSKKVTPASMNKPAIKKAEKKKVEQKKPEVKKKAPVKAIPQAATVTHPAAPKVSVTAKEPVIKKSGMPGAVITKIIEKRDRPLEQEKIDEVRQAIITILWKKENILADDLKRETSKQVSFGTDSEFSHYFRHVIEILTRYRLIEEVPDRRPLHLRLAQKLDS